VTLACFLLFLGILVDPPLNRGENAGIFLHAGGLSVGRLFGGCGWRRKHRGLGELIIPRRGSEVVRSEIRPGRSFASVGIRIIVFGCLGSRNRPPGGGRRRSNCMDDPPRPQPAHCMGRRRSFIVKKQPVSLPRPAEGALDGPEHGRVSRTGPRLSLSTLGMKMEQGRVGNPVFFGSHLWSCSPSRLPLRAGQFFERKLFRAPGIGMGTRPPVFSWDSF